MTLLHTRELVFITGKGGGGRTTVAPPRSYASGSGSWQKTTTSCPRRAHARASARV